MCGTRPTALDRSGSISSQQGDEGRVVNVLSVDLGTSNTVAVLSAHGRPPRVVDVDGASMMPSAVFAAEDGTLVVGRDAERRARLDPARFEPNPKRRVDEGTLLLGDQVVPVTDALAGVLRRVVDETSRQLGGESPDEVRLTHPAQWGPVRRNVLLSAARLAGTGPNVLLVPEPVATAARRTRRALQEDVKAAKEALSRHPQTEVPMPEPFKDVLVTRGELEGLVRPAMLRSVELMARTLRSSGLSPDRLAGIYLVGGSSRLPLVGTMIAEKLGVVPGSLDQPETAVALGAQHVARDGLSMRTQNVEGSVAAATGTGAHRPPTGAYPPPQVASIPGYQQQGGYSNFPPPSNFPTYNPAAEKAEEPKRG